MSKSQCELMTLAQTPLIHVQHCQHCGCVSLSMGPTTVRMDALAMESLWVVLGDAAATLHAQAQRGLRVVT